MHDLDPSDYFSHFSETKVFSHPQLSSEANVVKQELRKMSLTAHIALFSSGTSSRSLKGYALSLQAMEINAVAVNEFFKLKSSDVWGLSLPDYHVGGLSVLMRAKLLGNQVVDCRGWEPHTWAKKIKDSEVTVTTVVPAQVYDLVQANLTPPPLLRLLIVGGDFLSSELEKRALSLGWPVIRTYGMSEVCSQLASTRPGSTQLEILPIHEVKTAENGQLMVKSSSLFTLQFELTPSWVVKYASDLIDENGFYKTQDRAEVTGRHLRPLGRLDDQIKVSGHLVDTLGLKESLSRVLLEKNLYGKVEMVIEGDEKRGKKLVLLHLPEVGPKNLKEIQEELSPHVFHEVRVLDSFQRTDLGKLKSTGK